MRTFFLLCICAIVLSCGASNKLTREAETAINGVWILKKASYQTNHAGRYIVTIFNDIPLNCIQNTNWEFISNNNTGSYALSGTSCPSQDIQNFIWSVPKEMYGFNHSIMLKPVNQYMKSDIQNKGYRMQLYELKERTMTWEYDAVVEAEKFSVRLFFEKQ